MIANHKTKILEATKRYFGWPFVPIECPAGTTVDDVITQYFLEPALIEYFTRRPFEYSVEVVDDGVGRFLQIPDMDTVLLGKLPTGTISYFVGVTYMSSPVAETVNTRGNYTLSDYLPLMMGGSLHGGLNISQFDEMYMQLSMVGTMQDVMEKPLMFRHDVVENRLCFTPFVGKVGVTLGYGFNNCKFVQPQHFKVVAMLTAVELGQALKASRGAVDFELEIKLNPNVFDEVLQRLTEKLVDELENITIPLLHWT